MPTDTDPIPDLSRASLPTLLTTDDLAELLKLSPAAVRAAIRRGDVPGARRLGRRWRIHRDTFLASFRGPQPPPKARLPSAAQLLAPTRSQAGRRVRRSDS